MVKGPPISASVPKAPSDGDGHAVANKILLSLPPKERDQVLSKLELVRLKLHQVIHEAGETIKSGYFVIVGVIPRLARYTLFTSTALFLSPLQIKFCAVSR